MNAQRAAVSSYVIETDVLHGQVVIYDVNTVLYLRGKSYNTELVLC